MFVLGLPRKSDGRVARTRVLEVNVSGEMLSSSCEELRSLSCATRAWDDFVGAPSRTIPDTCCSWDAPRSSVTLLIYLSRLSSTSHPKIDCDRKK